MGGRVIDNDARHLDTIQVGDRRRPYPSLDAYRHRDAWKNADTVRQQAKQLAEDLAAERQKLEKDGRFTAAGVDDRMREKATETIHTIRKLRAATVDLSRPALEQRRRDLTEQATGYREGDVRQELQQAEIRAAIRSMKDRSKYLLTEASPEIRAAVVTAPGMLSGITEQLREQTRGLLLRDRVGSELEDLEEQMEADQLLADAFDTAEAAALQNSGISEINDNAGDEEPESSAA